MSNIISRVKAAQGLKFPTNQEVTMNADGSGGPISVNKDAKFLTTMYGGKSGGTTEKHKEIEKSNTRSGYEKFSDYGHVALDGLGMIPAFGAIADGINAAWYAGEGDMWNAGGSLLSAVPGFGQYRTAAKYGKKGYDAVKFSAKNAPKSTIVDVGLGAYNIKNSAEEIANTDYNKPKVQEEISALESERRGDEAINDPMSSGKTKSWSKGYSDYKSGGGKGSLSDFKNEANSWWNSAAGQKYAKDKNIKHRIASPSKQRYMGGVASSNRQSLKYYKQ